MNTLNKSEKARLHWHCRRGMLELDLILQRFMMEGINDLDTAQIKVFERLLTYPDPILFTWFMGHERPQEKELRELITFIRNYY